MSTSSRPESGSGHDQRGNAGGHALGSPGKSAVATHANVLWNALSHNDRLTRAELEEEHNLTRVLFLMSLADKLDYIRYDAEGDSIGLEK